MYDDIQIQLEEGIDETDSASGHSELVNLKISDIDFAAGQFKVFSKGAKERIVPMGLTTRRKVVRYTEHYRSQPVNPNEIKICVHVSGQGDKAHRFTPRHTRNSKPRGM